MIFKIYSLFCFSKTKQMKKIISFLAAAAIIGSYGCNQNCDNSKTAFNMDSVKAAIAASNISYGEAHVKKDSIAFVSHYTKDAIIYPNNMPSITGAPGLTAFFNGGISFGVGNIVLTTDELFGGNESVAEIGKYEVKDTAGNNIENGKFIVIWKQEEGKWKMHRDIWNADAPPPPPPPAKK